MVAFLHILIFLDLDNGIAWDFFSQTIVQKPYILFGMATFLLLIPLAVTSFDVWKVRLGRNWTRLHRLVYIISPLQCCTMPSRRRATSSACRATSCDR